MYRYKIVFLCLWLLLPLGMMAQKKQLSQARDILKEGKEPTKAETLMQDLLKDSVNKDNIKIWTMLFEAHMATYEQYNERLYVGQQQDTTVLFQTTSKLFHTAVRLDSIDARSDKKGKIQPRQRTRNAAYLNAIRPNLFNGGAFSVRRQQLKEAIAYFEQYIDCARQPLFAVYDYPHTDQHLSQAAYWAMYCSNHLGYHDDVLAYSSLAEGDTIHLPYIIQYRSEAFAAKNDTTDYVNELRRGFDHYPLHTYFFPRLIEYYEQQKDYDTAMQLINQALAADSLNILFRFAQSNVFLNTKHYDECIAISDQLIAENDLLADTYYNAGLAYFNKAIDVEKILMRGTFNKSTRRKYQAQKETFYRQSLSYLEHYRSIAPELKERWSAPLYTIYLNLNMGKEFEEIQKVRGN